MKTTVIQKVDINPLHKSPQPTEGRSCSCIDTNSHPSWQLIFIHCPINLEIATMVDSNENLKLQRFVLVATNAVTCLVWLRVLSVYAFPGWGGIAGSDEVCEKSLRPVLATALGVSMVELATALLGLTRSKPIQVLLFAAVRTGTEHLVTPLIGCRSWQHIFTAFCWSLGEVVRFGCFAADGLLPGQSLAKSIRYSVGPILFPLGAAGEMLMVIQAARDGRPRLYLAAMLWPVGFYPLMNQLLRQRRKHFRPKAKPEIKQI